MRARKARKTQEEARAARGGSGGTGIPGARNGTWRIQISGSARRTGPRPRPSALARGGVPGHRAVKGRQAAGVSACVPLRLGPNQGGGKRAPRIRTRPVLAVPAGGRLSAVRNAVGHQPAAACRKATPHGRARARSVRAGLPRPNHMAARHHILLHPPFWRACGNAVSWTLGPTLPPLRTLSALRAHSRRRGGARNNLRGRTLQTLHKWAVWLKDTSVLRDGLHRHYLAAC